MEAISTIAKLPCTMSVYSINCYEQFIECLFCARLFKSLLKSLRRHFFQFYKHVFLHTRRARFSILLLFVYHDFSVSLKTFKTITPKCSKYFHLVFTIQSHQLNSKLLIPISSIVKDHWKTAITGIFSPWIFIRDTTTCFFKKEFLEKNLCLSTRFGYLCRLFLPLGAFARFKSSLDLDKLTSGG